MQLLRGGGCRTMGQPCVRHSSLTIGAAQPRWELEALQHGVFYGDSQQGSSNRSRPSTCGSRGAICAVAEGRRIMRAPVDKMLVHARRCCLAVRLQQLKSDQQCTVAGGTCEQGIISFADRHCWVSNKWWRLRSNLNSISDWLPGNERECLLSTSVQFDAACECRVGSKFHLKGLAHSLAHDMSNKTRCCTQSFSKPLLWSVCLSLCICLSAETTQSVAASKTLPNR